MNLTLEIIFRVFARGVLSLGGRSAEISWADKLGTSYEEVYLLALVQISSVNINTHYNASQTHVTRQQKSGAFTSEV